MTKYSSYTKKNNINISDSDKEEEVGDTSCFDEDVGNEESNKPKSMPTFSVAAMMGTTQPQTVKVFGYIKKTKIIVLIASGNSHNFIDTTFAKQLNMFFYPTSDIQIVISRDRTTSCDGKCNKVELTIDNHKLISPMYAMVIGGVDIILGAQWLASIGTVRLNLQKQFLSFYESKKKYKFHGINNLPTQLFSSNKMKKMIWKGARAYLLHCSSMEEMYDETKYPNGINKMLEKYDTIFQHLPRGLPPIRSRDHIIELIS
jgi:hypothetical protein